MNLLSEKSDVSSKRFITICAFGLLAICFLIDLFTSGFEISKNIYEGMEYIVITGVGFVTVDGIMKSKKKSDTITENDSNKKDDEDIPEGESEAN
jgi:hypothetical protein